MATTVTRTIAPCGDYVGCFEAIVNAIVDDNAQLIRAILATGYVGPNDLFDAQATQRVLKRSPFNWSTVARIGGAPASSRLLFGREGEHSTILGVRPLVADDDDASALVVPTVSLRSTAGIVRSLPMTPLAIAAAHGSVNAARALIEAGARPWPTPETVLNEALATAPVAQFERPNSAASPYDVTPLVALLLDSFERQRPLDPWDVNPLTVVDNIMYDDVRTTAVVTESSGLPKTPTLVAMLLEAGYSPDERASAVSDVAVVTEDVRSTAEYDALRRDLASIDETYTLVSRIDKVQDRMGQDDEEGVAPSPIFLAYEQTAFAVLDEYAEATPEAERARFEFIEWGVTRPGALVAQRVQTSVQNPYQDNGGIGGDGGGDDDDNNGQGNADLLSQLPPEMLAAIMRASGASMTNPTPLAEASHRLRELALSEAFREAWREVAPACADYIGCASALVDAIGRDDVDTVAAIVTSGRVPIDGFIDTYVLDQLASPEVSLRASSESPRAVWSVSPFVSADRSSRPHGYPYATPVSLAAGANAQRTMAWLLRRGARAVWPETEAVLSHALSIPLATRVATLTEPWGGINTETDTDNESESEPEPGPKHLSPERPVDTVATVRRITAARSRSVPLGP